MDDIARQRARDGPTTRGWVGSSNPTLLPPKEGAAPFTLTTLSLIVAFPPANDLPFHEAAAVSFTGEVVPARSPLHPPVEENVPLTILPDVMLTFPQVSVQALKPPVMVTVSDPVPVGNRDPQVRFRTPWRVFG